MPFSKFLTGVRVVINNRQFQNVKAKIVRCYPDPGEGTFNYAVQLDNGQVVYGVEEKHMRPA